MVVYFIASIAFFIWVDWQAAAYLILGILVGVLISNYALVRTQLKIWPLQRKVLDWPKVEKMAAGEPLDGW